MRVTIRGGPVTDLQTAACGPRREGQRHTDDWEHTN